MSKKPTSKPGKPSVGSVSSLDLGQLERVLELMGRHRLGELEWEDANIRLHLKSQVGTQPSPQVVYAPAPKKEEAKSASNGLAANQKQITSPFVGTFYRSASPSAEPYVKEGKSVKRGDTLCIIEAMKLMNEIESEMNGKIVSVLIENGQPVEFGEPLFVVEV